MNFNSSIPSFIRNHHQSIFKSHIVAYNTYQLALKSLSTLSAATTHSPHFDKVQKSAFKSAKKWFKNYIENTSSSDSGASEPNVSLAAWANYRNHAAFFEKKTKLISADDTRQASSSASDGVAVDEQIEQQTQEQSSISLQLKRSLYTRHVLPQTLAMAKELNILQDCLGEDLAHATLGNLASFDVYLVSFDVY